MTGTAGEEPRVERRLVRLVDEHDLLRVLAAVRGAAAILVREGPSLTPQQRLQLLDVVHEQSSQAMKIVRDAFVASRADGGEAEDDDD